MFYFVTKVVVKKSIDMECMVVHSAVMHLEQAHFDARKKNWRKKLIYFYRKLRKKYNEKSNKKLTGYFALGLCLCTPIFVVAY